MIKRLTLLRRAPATSAEMFAQQWCAQRTAMLGSIDGSPRPHRVVECVVRSTSTAPWDALEISWHDGGREADSLSWANSANTSELVERVVTFVVEERVVNGGDWLANHWASGASLGPVLLGFVEAAPGWSRTAFRDYWWNEHRPFANELVPDELAPTAYVHNYLLDEASLPDDLPWAGIGEMYETTLATARGRGEWFESPAAAPLIADEEKFLVRASRQVLVADGVVVLPLE